MMKYIAAILSIFIVSCSHNSVSERPRSPAGVAMVRPGFVTYGQLDPKKQTVCSITLNSDNEVRAFQRGLSPKDFQFVELADQDKATWLADAVQKNIKCDILVISGHFGGSFFGESGMSLGLEELEKQSCDAKGSGILHSPKEVFLFGCNTLAGKDRDSRTPQQYRSVLMQDGFSAGEAEEIATLRYSPIGQSFAGRMSQVFAGVPRIYGFDSIAPLGEHVEGYLDKYFKSKKNYASYLRSLDSSRNEEFLKALKETAITQVSGVANIKMSSSPLCFLGDSAVPDSQKIDWIAEVLRSPDSRLSHLGEIDYYLSNHGRTSPNNTRADAKLAEISHDQKLASEMKLVLTKGLSEFPFLQVELSNIAQFFGWLSINEVDTLKENIVASKMKGDSFKVEDKDFLCSLGQSIQSAISLSVLEKPFNSGSATERDNVLQLIRCTGVNSLDIQFFLFDQSQKEKILASKKNILEVLGRMVPAEMQIVAKVYSQALIESDPSTKALLLETLGLQAESVVLNRDIQESLFAIAQGTGNETVRNEAIRALGNTKSKDPRYSSKFLDMMNRQYGSMYLLAIALIQLNSSDPVYIDQILKVASTTKFLQVAIYTTLALGKSASSDPRINQFLANQIKTPDSDLFRVTIQALADRDPSGTFVPDIIVKILQDRKQDAQSKAYAESALSNMVISDAVQKVRADYIAKVERSKRP